MKRHIVLALAALALAAPVAARAQDVPSYAAGDEQGAGDQQIRGRILSFDGAYSLAVRDDQGYVDNVELHQGTIINPTGLTLEPGMVVNILGYNSGPYLSANEIDTPYTYGGGGIPYYSGHPWNYYGPTIGLSFFFGGGAGWWHGSGYPRYDYAGRTRVYNDVHIRNVYRENDRYQGQPSGGYDSARRYPQGGYRQNGGPYGTGYSGGGVRREPVQNGNFQGGAFQRGNVQRQNPGGNSGGYRGNAGPRGGEQHAGGQQGGARGGESHGGGGPRGGDSHH